MAGSTLSLTKRSPRWWRRFVVASRRANFFLILEIASAIGLAAMIATTWFTFDSAPSDGRLVPAGQVASLLIGTLLPAMALVVLLGRRLALRRAAGSTARLHVRLVFFFSLVAAIPTLLVAGFAAVLFQRGTGYILEVTNSNSQLIFIVCGFAYLLGLAGFHLLAPRLEPVRIGRR